MAASAADLVIRRLSPIELRQRAPFVVFNRVRAGDVLLTRGSDATSKLIARAGGGKFSHAAIWLPHWYPEVPNHLTLIEADEFGIGATPLKLLLLDFGDISPLLVASLPDCPEQYRLLRHPQIELRSSDELAAASKIFWERHLHRSYSNLARLTNAADLALASRLLAEALGRAVDAVRQRRNPKLRPGAFCSELVALYFRELGLSLFKTEVDPATISPNHFISEASLLQDVRGAFIDRAAITDQASGSDEHAFAWSDRKTFLPSKVSAEAQNAYLDRQITAVIQGFRTDNEAMVVQQRELSKHFKTRIVESLRQARLRGDQCDVNFLERTAASVLMLECLDQFISEEARLFEEANNDDKTRLYCIAWLRTLHNRFSTDLSHKFLRHKVLMRVKMNRRERDKPASVFVRIHLHWQRVRFLGRWQEDKSSHVRYVRFRVQWDEDAESQAARSTDFAKIYIQRILESAVTASLRGSSVIH